MIDFIVDWIVTHAIWLFNALFSTSLGLLDSILPKIMTGLVFWGIWYFITEMID